MRSPSGAAGENNEVRRLMRTPDCRTVVIPAVCPNSGSSSSGSVHQDPDKGTTLHLLSQEESTGFKRGCFERLQVNYDLKMSTKQCLKKQNLIHAL